MRIGSIGTRITQRAVCWQWWTHGERGKATSLNENRVNTERKGERNLRDDDSYFQEALPASAVLRHCIECRSGCRITSMRLVKMRSWGSLGWFDNVLIIQRNPKDIVGMRRKRTKREEGRKTAETKGKGGKKKQKIQALMVLTGHARL